MALHNLRDDADLSSSLGHILLLIYSFIQFHKSGILFLICSFIQFHISGIDIDEIGLHWLRRKCHESQDQDVTLYGTRVRTDVGVAQLGENAASEANLVISEKTEYVERTIFHTGNDLKSSVTNKRHSLKKK